MGHGKRPLRSIARFPLSIVIIPSALACVLFFAGCSTSVYLVKLGWGQARVVVRSRSNERILNDATLDASTKEKIRLVMEVKAYAEKHIGLDKTSNYSTFYRVEGPALLYVVSASQRDRLEPCEWWFPITGSVTSKGFFDREDAIREREKLEKKGLDVFVQGAQAYSTLGWFRDPIFSTMLDQDPAMVVNVVIHEMTHATVFFKNQFDFNEQIATFVGGQGAIDFTGARFGRGSSSRRQAEGLMHDSVLFATFMRDLYDRLHALYNRPDPMATKLQEREVIFLEAKNTFRALRKYLKTDFFLGFEEVKLNNAAVLALGRYIANIEHIQGVYEKLGKDLKKTVAFFKEMEKSGIEDPQAYIVNWLRERGTEASNPDGQRTSRQACHWVLAERKELSWLW